MTAVKLIWITPDAELHYVDLRSGNGTQKEHAEIAKAIGGILRQQVPTIHAAMWGSNGGDLAS